MNEITASQDREVSILTEVAMQREIAEVQAAMAIAKRFPRSHLQAIDRITIVCQRPALAEGALYTYARGGTDITGPSIRLAEAIAQQWGNLQFGIRELEQRIGESTVEAYAWDLETNVRENKIFQVKHTRHTKGGSYLLKDPRDIYEMVANQGARRLRACILGIIPGDVVEAAVNQCEATLKAQADTTPDALQKMVAVFGTIGVTQEMLEVRIQRKLESIAPAQVISLRKIYNSIKDGMSKPADWFEAPPAPEPKGKTTTKAAAPKAEVKPEPEKPVTETQVQHQAPSGITFPVLMDLVQKAQEGKGAVPAPPIAVASYKDGGPDLATVAGIGIDPDTHSPTLTIHFADNLAELADGLTPEQVIKSFGEAGIIVYREGAPKEAEVTTVPQVAPKGKGAAGMALF